MTAESGSRDETEPGGETVLVVEDEDLVRRLVQRVLELAGYELLVASDGEQALHVLESHPGPIDLVVTDIAMPRLRGPELVARLGAIRPATPVIFMSGYVAADPSSAVTVDPEQVLKKPFRPGELLEKVRLVLRSGPPSGV